jgi:hypothetical protein
MRLIVKLIIFINLIITDVQNLTYAYIIDYFWMALSLVIANIAALTRFSTVKLIEEV